MFITAAGDDAKFTAQLAELLRQQGHRVSLLSPSDSVVDSCRAAPPQLLILALGTTESMTAALKSLRAHASMRGLPILSVNPRGSSSDGVAALDAGADDFLNRPFNPQIFAARARTLLRRGLMTGTVEPDPVTAVSCGAVSLNLVSRQALVAGQPVILTRLEFDLLAYLLHRPDQVLKRQELLEAVWNYPQGVETRTLDKHVENLRRKVAGGGVIETVHGVGYRLVPPSEKTANSSRR